jgi:hypothetical protein
MCLFPPECTGRHGPTSIFWDQPNTFLAAGREAEDAAARRAFELGHVSTFPSRAFRASYEV